MRFLIYIGLVLYSFHSWGQISFYKAYSNGGYDEANGVCQLADSSYLITGSSSSFGASNQAFILKVDSLGTYLWSKQFGGSESDIGKRIFHVANDGIYVAGQSNSAGNGFFDAYFFKTDENGNVLYEKQYGTPRYEAIHDALMLADTSFILVGETLDEVNEVEDMYLLRINRFGDTLWTKKVGSEGYDVARSLALLNDSTVIVGGSTYVADSLTSKAVLMSFHINGSLNWEKKYGLHGFYQINDMTIDDGYIRCVGYTKSTANPNRKNVFAMICYPDGNYPGIYTEYSASDYEMKAMTHYGTDPSTYYFATEVTNDLTIPTFEDGSDVYIYKFHSEIYFLGAGFAPSYTGEDKASEIIATSDGGAMMVGSNQNPMMGGKNALLVKIGPADYFPYSLSNPSVFSLVKVNEVIENNLTVYPTPVSSVLTIETNQEDKILVYNELGKMITEWNLTVGKNELNVQNLPSACYFLHFESGKKAKLIKY